MHVKHTLYVEIAWNDVNNGIKCEKKSEETVQKGVRKQYRR